MSQLELEILIESSLGSISRIESNKVNPTKETLAKVANVLELNIVEISDLYGLESNLIVDILSLIKEFNEIDDLDEFLQTSINKIVFELNLLGGIIGLIDGEKLRVNAFSLRWYAQFVIKTIPIPIKSLYVDINNKENYFYNLIHNKEVVYSERLHDFAPEQMSQNLSNIIQKFTNQVSAIAIPLIHKDKVIGAIYLTKQYKDDFSFELSILRELSDIITQNIVRLS